MSKVSIVIPVYNVEKYVEECLQSVINQTYKNLEIIIINDGSMDSSGKICDEYASRDERIKVVHTVNQGAANAKNEGLNRITGDYFCFVDSDDYYEPEFVETMLNAINKYNCEIVQCQFGNVYVNRKEPYGDCDKVKCFSSYEFMLDFANRWQDAIFCNKMFRTELLEDIRFSQHRYIDDEFFTYKLVLNAKNVVEIPAVLYNYRMRKSSVTKSAEAQKKILLDQADFSTERYDYVKKYHAELKQHLLEYMVTVFIQIRNSSFADKAVLKYVKNKVKKHIKDIIFGKYDAKIKFTFIKKYIKKKKYSNVTVNTSMNQENYFE